MKEVQIGSQVWAQEDLKVMRFRNGDEIPVVQDPKEWSKMESAAMCINTYTLKYFYNWYAVNDPRGLAPKGWHVPTDEEWTTLTDYLGGKEVAGKKMKHSKKWNDTNSSGFSGFLSGNRNNDGYFGDEGIYGTWWSSSRSGLYCAWNRRLITYYDTVNRYGSSQRDGLSVRCIKGESVVKPDLRKKFGEYSDRIDALTEEINKKFDELTSRLDAMAEEMEIMQSTIESFWVSKKP